MTDDRPRALPDQEALLEALLGPSESLPSPSAQKDDGDSSTDLLLDYLEGKLDQAQERSLQERLLAEPAFTRQLLDLEAFVKAEEVEPSTVRDLPTAAGWKDFQRRLEARSTRNWGPWWLQAAASLLLVSTVVLGGLQLQSGSGKAQIVAIVPNLQTLNLDPTLRSDEEFLVTVPAGQPLRLVVTPETDCPLYEMRIESAKTQPRFVRQGKNHLGHLDILIFPEAGQYDFRLSGCEPRQELMTASFRVLHAPEGPPAPP